MMNTVDTGFVEEQTGASIKLSLYDLLDLFTITTISKNLNPHEGVAFYS